LQKTIFPEGVISVCSEIMQLNSEPFGRKLCLSSVAKATTSFSTIFSRKLTQHSLSSMNKIKLTAQVLFLAATKKPAKNRRNEKRRNTRNL